MRLLFHVQVQVNLFRNENRKIAILFVDLRPKRHEAQKIYAENHAPQHQLPVAEVLEEVAIVLQELNAKN